MEQCVLELDCSAVYLYWFLSVGGIQTVGQWSTEWLIGDVRRKGDNLAVHMYTSHVLNKNVLIFLNISLWSSKYTLTVCPFPKRMTLSKWSQSTLNKQSVNYHIASPLSLIFNFYYNVLHYGVCYFLCVLNIYFQFC